MTALRKAVLAALLVLVPRGASAADPEINPFECLGRYESATGNRTIGQMRHELKQRFLWLEEPDEPKTVRAMKLCVIAKLMARVGDADAGEYFERSIEADPSEPGYELWAAQYWDGNRGARRPVTELAEKHYYAALEKLKARRDTDRFRAYHAVVEDWVRRGLLVLYQQDGQPLLPWKAYRQDEGGLDAPGLSVSSQLRVAKSTRDFFYNNEVRQFTGELVFAQSDIRANGKLTPRQIWDIPRAPLRLQVDDRLRIRQRYVGAIDVLQSYSHSYRSQITSFYKPTQTFNDVKVQQYGAGYERVIPLYPLFDLRLAGDVQRVVRTGAVEFLPDREERFWLYELKPSISRFLGADKLTMSGVYARLDLPSSIGAPPAEAMRQKVIRAVSLEYGLYSPLVLPTFELGTLSTYRTPTRGLYLFGGFMQDDEVWGLHTITARDFYGGMRFEGPANTDFTLQGTYATSLTTFVDENSPVPTVFTDEHDAPFSLFRTTFVLVQRLRSADTFPGVPPATLGFASDMVHLVFPVQWDKTLTGPDDYEDIRGGAQIWTKLIGTGIGGTALLATVGYEAQYFYKIKKTIHNAELALRMGWGDL